MRQRNFSFFSFFLLSVLNNRARLILTKPTGPKFSHIITDKVSLEAGLSRVLRLSMAEWLRALDLKSGGPRFKSSTLLLSGFVLGSSEFNSSTALC